MTAQPGTPREFPHVIGVVGAASNFGAQLLLYLEKERPDCWLVAVAERPLRWPVERISTYRLAQNRVGGILTMSDIPDFMQQKAWDMFLEGHELTVADIPDVLQLEGVDSLVHVGSYYDGPNPEQFCADAQLWLRSARIAGVRQFIYLSDVRVYGVNANNPVPHHGANFHQSQPPAPLPRRCRTRLARRGGRRIIGSGQRRRRRRNEGRRAAHRNVGQRQSREPCGR